jgi:hypothetical protein
MKCGGPASGRGFPAYKGPMQDHLNTFCFICGKDASAGVEIGGRVLGACHNMGPNGQTCVDKLKLILERQRVIVKEFVVPVVGGAKS